MDTLRTLGRTFGLVAMAFIMTLSAAAIVAAQESLPDELGTTPYASLYRESCNAFPSETTYADIGHMEQVDYGDAVDDLFDDAVNDAWIDDAESLYEDDEDFITEDLDDDGILDDDEDLNDNGVLDVGIDVDADGVLDEDEIVTFGDAGLTAANVPTVWKVESEISENFDEIFGENLTVAVRASATVDDPLLACGEVTAMAWEDQDQVVVGLRAIDNSGFYGYAVFERDTGDFPIFGDNETGVTVYMFENLLTQRESRASATPEP